MFITFVNNETKYISLWNDYVLSSPSSNLYHLFGWKNVIEKTYGHKTYYLMAFNRNPVDPVNPVNHADRNDQVTGILPLVHLKHFFFGNNLISMPFFDMGGILADGAEAEMALLSEAIKLGQKLRVKNIELRHTNPIAALDHSAVADNKLEDSGKKSRQSCKSCQKKENSLTITTKSHKVRMLLSLPESSDLLMKSFKSKLRSQIKKPLKEGLQSKIGGIELLDDFYKVFSTNMRDLGSPVHSKKFIKSVVVEFSDSAKIVIVYKVGIPLACSIIIGFKDTLENPWASALREYAQLNPNMLLYWSALEYACDNGYSYFDFGRSSPDEGTFKFKEQWGAKQMSLYWHYISNGAQNTWSDTTEKSNFEKAIKYWQRLPIALTRIFGPPIRKHIGL